MEIEIVKWFQSFSNGFLDTLFSLITRFGESIFFVCVFLFIYWCISYDKAFKLALFYIISVCVNSIVKTLVARPRPWQASGDVVNKLQASGYSFPSGHSQSVASISTFVCYSVFKEKNSKNYIKITSIILAIILCFSVAISRLYLGQHYLTDVLTGLTIGCLVMLGLNLLFDFLHKKYNFTINSKMVLIVVSSIMFVLMTLVSFYNFNFSAGFIYKIFKYSGLLIGSTVGFILCTNFIKIENMNKWQKILKLFIGYFVVFGLYYLLKLIPNSNSIIFVVMIVCSFVATFVYPYVFNIIFNKVKKEV